MILNKNYRVRYIRPAAQPVQRPVTIPSPRSVPRSVLVAASVKKVLFATK